MFKNANMNDLALHLLDIVQNSISAAAKLISVLVNEQPGQNLLTVRIADDGKGMTAEQVSKVTDPYFTSRTTRKVGLGLPLFKQSAETSGGDMIITSEVGVGTTVTATFEYDHIDRLPLGNIANAVVLLVSANPLVEFVYTHRYGAEEYVFDTKEVKDALDGVPLNDPEIVKALEEMITENIKALKSCN
jgi:anti-sigma regulatory factor (Ser/Thr protein kinase)